MEEAPVDNIQFWREKLPELKEKLDELISAPLPFVPNSLLERLAEDSREHAVEEAKPDLAKCIYNLVDSCRLPLSKLATQVKHRLLEWFPDLIVSSDELIELIHNIGRRKALGVKRKEADVYEDTDALGFWYWEIDEHKQPKPIRDERAKLGKLVRALHKLITELEKDTTTAGAVTSLHDAYNTCLKSYVQFKDAQEQLHQKKKERMQLALEKRRKLEEEKHEKIMKREEEKLKKEEEKLKKEEARREQAKSRHSNQPSVTSFFKPSEAKRVDKLEPEVVVTQRSINTTALPGDLESWQLQWAEHRPQKDTRPKYVYIHDSNLKPYFIGWHSATSASINYLEQYEAINYERDSEEEYAEIFGEDLSKEGDDDESESSDEEDASQQFIVPDQCPSDLDESEQDDVFPHCNLGFVEKPMKIHGPGSEFLAQFAAYTYNRTLPVPITITEPPATVEKPANIDDHLEVLVEVAGERLNKVDIINAFLEKCPNFSKASIKRKLREKFVKVNDSTKKGYFLREL